MRIALLVLGIFLITSLPAQVRISGVVADSSSRQVLPFATVQLPNKSSAAVADIKGVFRITIPPNTTSFIVSYSGYRTRKIAVDEFHPADTLFLSPAGELAEVVIRPEQNEIRRIINTAINNKQNNNPEFYDNYQCNIYYKMHVDLPGIVGDSERINKYLLIAETYSRRLYKRPQKIQETIIASRFSGLKKTYFTNMITDILPFHVYSNYINLNEQDYVNPIAPGWQQRYRFSLLDQLNMGEDTVYVLSFTPRSRFLSLQGTVYINSNGYAISHMMASTADTSSDRQVHFEQVYTFVKGKWFPRELNYDFNIRNVFSKEGMIQWNGHSVIDSVSFDPLPGSAFDKSHSLKLSDSVDLHSSDEWVRLRKDSLGFKEKNTYEFVDSFSNAFHLERFIAMASRVNLGRVPVGKLDVDVNRLYASNDFEGSRFGAGLYTNDKISRYYSVGGWAGYGVQDKTWKYGASLTLYPNGKKENWWSLSYEKNYGIPGEVELHEDLQNSFSNWLLGRVDLVKQYATTANLQLGYWQLRPGAKYETAQPLYDPVFNVNGKTPTSFTNKEASLGIRYAYGEKRYPVYDYYEAAGTKYPIAYLQVGKGSVQATGYKAAYTRMILSIKYHYHAAAWGNDHYRWDGGYIRTKDKQPLPQSYLLAANGFKLDKAINFYEPGGFITLRPFDYYTDQYTSFYYKHDFDKFLWKNKWSKPYISLAHNLMYGSLGSPSGKANPSVRSLPGGYHESGFLLNQLFRLNLHFVDVYLNGGVFYHWNKEHDWNRNSAWVVSVSAAL